MVRISIFRLVSACFILTRLFTLVHNDGGPDGFPRRLAMFVFQVTFTIGFGGESVIAQFTFVRFFTGVGAHVPGQGAFVIAAVGAGPYVADVRRLSQVFFVVALEGSKIGVDSRAEPAWEFSFEFHILDDGIFLQANAFMSTQEHRWRHGTMLLRDPQCL